MPSQSEDLAFELYCIENGIALQRFANSDSTKAVEAIMRESETNTVEEVAKSPIVEEKPNTFDSLFGEVSDSDDEDCDDSLSSKPAVVAPINPDKVEETDEVYVAGGHNVHVASRAEAIQELQERTTEEAEALSAENAKFLEKENTSDVDSDLFRKAGEAKTLPEISEDEFAPLSPQIEELLPFLSHERADVREVAAKHIAGLTGTSSGRLLLVHTRVLSRLAPMVDDSSAGVAKEILTALVNLSQIDRFRKTLASLKLNLISRLLERGFGVQANADGLLGLRIMLLANLSADDVGNRQLLELHRRKVKTTSGEKANANNIVGMRLRQLAAFFICDGKKRDDAKIKYASVDVSSLSVKELKSLIDAAGLTSKSKACVSKSDLRELAKEAQEKLQSVEIGDVMTDPYDGYQYAGHCLLNAARIKEGRNVLLRRDSGLLPMLVRQLSSSNRVRRLGVIGMLKNLCWHVQFDEEAIEWMLSGEDPWRNGNSAADTKAEMKMGAGVLIAIIHLIDAERQRLSKASTDSAFALGGVAKKGESVSEGGHINQAGCDPRVMLTALELIIKVGESPKGFEILCRHNDERTNLLRDSLNAVKSSRCGSARVLGNDGVGLLNAAISLLDPARSEAVSGAGVEGGLGGAIRPGMFLPLEAVEEAELDGEEKKALTDACNDSKSQFDQLEEMD